MNFLKLSFNGENEILIDMDNVVNIMIKGESIIISYVNEEYRTFKLEEPKRTFEKIASRFD